MSFSADTATKYGKSTVYENLRPGKGGSFFDSQEFGAMVTPGEEVTLTCLKKGEEEPSTIVFKVGDVCIYGSYNLVYTGEILAIGAKTVTINAGGTGQGNKRLDLYKFAWRNYDYNAERIAKRNSEWYD